MTNYHSKKGVSRYVDMAEGFDGRELIAELRQHLPPGKTILELGMGPGKDLALLAEHYVAIGSDYSSIFLDRYRATTPDADILLLDAVTLDTHRRFDGIYSNKVLIHLSDEDLAATILRQAEVLTGDGVVMHSFWHGDAVEEYPDMTAYYRTEDYLRGAFSECFEIIALQRYAEFEDRDSVYIIAKLKKSA